MQRFILTLAAISLATLHAAPVPLELSRPDGKPGSSEKPVKVYILAGQSNMVGMGDIEARSPYPAVYLAAAPAIIPGKMPSGTHRSKSACRWLWNGVPALGHHGVYQTAEGDANGALASIFKGSREVNTTTMKLGQVGESVPTMDGATKTVAKAFIDVPVTGNYLVHGGYGESTHAIAQLGGQEVYRKQAGGQPALTKITLEAGKRHPLTITYHKLGSAALWLEQVDLVGRGDQVALTQMDGKSPFLIDDQGEWTVRQDVHFREARVLKGDKSGPLTATSNGRSIGPELGFGFVMGSHHDEQVLLIKTAMGMEAAGSDEYSWKPVLPGMEQASWDILGFDLANNPYDQKAPGKGETAKPSPVELKLPTGQENWFTPGFDPRKAGWNSAPAPFGKAVGKEWPDKLAWLTKYPISPPSDRPIGSFRGLPQKANSLQ